MEIHQVRYFLMVAEHLNFTKAAHELGIAQPSLTRAIQKLESELDGPLFRRERAFTHLTELGRLMRPYLQAVQTATEAAREHARQIAGGRSGSLWVGVAVGLREDATIALVLDAMRAVADLELSVTVASTDVIEAALLKGQLDAAFLVCWDRMGERLQCDLVGEEVLVVALPNGHPLASRSLLTVSDLDAVPLVLHTGARLDGALLASMRDHGLRPLVRHRSDDANWVAALVRDGQGVAVLAQSQAQASALPHRVLDAGALRYRLALVTVTGRRRTAALSALLDAATSRHRSSNP